MQLAIIQSKIFEIRGVRVMLDYDLAVMYGIETRALKQAVRRNIKRFEGDDFMFELTRDEYNSLRSQIVTFDYKGILNPPVDEVKELQKEIRELKQYLDIYINASLFHVFRLIPTRERHGGLYLCSEESR